MACRQDWRPFRERAALRAFDAAQQVDERALRAKVKPLLKEGDVAMRAQMVRGVGHNEALLQNSKAFNDKMGAICNAAMEERDVRVCAIAKEHGADGLAALRVLGAIVPPWLRWKPKETRAACRELAETLDSTRPNREFELRSRVVRLETAQSYGNQRTKPSHLALRSVDHVISAADVANLRAGRTLVIDPQPALITPAAMASVQFTSDASLSVHAVYSEESARAAATGRGTRLARHASSSTGKCAAPLKLDGDCSASQHSFTKCDASSPAIASLLSSSYCEALRRTKAMQAALSDGTSARLSASERRGGAASGYADCATAWPISRPGRGRASRSAISLVNS